MISKLVAIIPPICTFASYREETVSISAIGIGQTGISGERIRDHLLSLLHNPSQMGFILETLRVDLVEVFRP